jgi:minor structural protein GP20
MADEPDDLEDDLDEDEDNESTGGSGDEDEYKAPDKDEWTRTQAALAKANGEAKKYRLALKAAKTNASNASTGGTGAGAGTDVETLKRAAAEEVEAKYRPQIMRTQVKAALAASGLVDADKPEVLKAAVRLVDLDDLDLDEDGDVVGLDEAVAALKTSFPAMFKRAKTGGTVRPGSRSNGSTGATGGAGGKPKSSASKLAASLR